MKTVVACLFILIFVPPTLAFLQLSIASLQDIGLSLMALAAGFVPIGLLLRRRAGAPTTID